MALNDKTVETQDTGTSPNTGDPVQTNIVAGAKDREERRAMRRDSGVIEGRPGIIEDTHIDPLDDGWTNVTVDPTESTTAAQTVSSTVEEVKVGDGAFVEK